MALPYQWADELVRQGWLRVLAEADIKTLWAVGRYMNTRSHEAYPHPETLARDTGLSRSGTYGSLSRLKKHGLISSEITLRPGKHRAYCVKVYRLADRIPDPPGIVHPDRPSSDEAQSTGADNEPGVQSTGTDEVVHHGGLESHETAGPERAAVSLTGQGTRGTTELASSTRAHAREELSTPVDGAFMHRRRLWVMLKEQSPKGVRLFIPTVKGWADRCGWSPSDLQARLQRYAQARARGAGPGARGGAGG